MDKNVYTDRIKEVLDDLDDIEEFNIEDTDDPDVIEITIRGRLKSNIGRPKTKQKDPVDTYDKVMKGIE